MWYPDEAHNEGRTPEQGAAASAPELHEAPRRVAPVTDVHETDDAVVLTFDLPGLRREDIELSLERGVLTVHGTVASPDLCDRERQVYEYPVREYRRAFELPDGVDTSNATAELDAGVLTVRLPKGEEARARRIPVQGS